MRSRMNNLMNKKIFVAMMVLILLSLAGCKNPSEKVNTVTGVLDEITSNYFYIEDKKGTYYQFAILEDNNIDLQKFQIGDEIIITYQGELSKTDMFHGKILNVEKK